MQLEPEPKTIKTRTLHQIRSNPFVTAVASALAFRSLLGDVYEKMPGPAAGAEKPLGVCVYDTQTILVGDHAVLEHFLTDLKDNGYPEYKTELSEPPLEGDAAHHLTKHPP